jgi:putative FmdB family regulatory protein
MPLYEYVCRGCGAEFEKRLRVEERLTAQECVACGQHTGALRMSVPARVGAGAGAEEQGYCPTTGNACGCGHALRN